MIEFKHIESVLWHKYNPSVNNVVKKLNTMFHIRIDGVVYENYTAEFLATEYNRQYIWRRLGAK